VHNLFSGIAAHGYVLIAIIVFAEAVGLPVPAALALVGGGAAVASGGLSGPVVLALAIAAMLLGDSLLFIMGRHMGWWLLGTLCRLSINPESCILRSAESFYKRGKTTLLFAKFIPGVNTMAPPLAGSMKMRFPQFLRLDAIGVSLYIVTYSAIGYVSRDFLTKLTRRVQTATHDLEEILLVAALAYTAYRISLYRKNRVYRVVPRIQVEELARKLATEGKGSIIVLDVRSHGYYDPHAERIQGSLRFEPNNLVDELKLLPKDKDIYLYCTCARQATSARVALQLRERGFNAFIIQGGLAAWRKAGQPLEPVPPGDLVKLPTFS
jgi:membrane protein DedA with SNARE-associated domain/rhodanese-related sulfurtransferase